MSQKKNKLRESTNVNQITAWQRLGNYEYEYDWNLKYTGRVRCVDGRMTNGIHPSWDRNGVETVS